VSAERLEGATLFAHPIATALFAVMRECGYGATTVEELLDRSAMSSAEFEGNFGGKADLTLRVFDVYIVDFKERVGRAYESAPTWPDDMRAAAYETARWLLDHPDAAWFGMVGALEAGEMALVRREETFKWAATLIEAGREVAPDPAAVPAAAPLIAMGAIVETLRRQQEGSVSEDVVEAVPKMMYAAVRPYLGEEAARRELEIPPPPDLRPEVS
jgi:AcrR family transcriptional regulator